MVECPEVKTPKRYTVKGNAATAYTNWPFDLKHSCFSAAGDNVYIINTLNVF